MEFYGVDMPLEVQPLLVLSVEHDELRVTVGLQDRVIQVYEGLVYMDFGRSASSWSTGCACYRTSRSIRRCCRRSISPTIDRSASRPKCFTTTSRSASGAATRTWSTACDAVADLAASARQALLARDADRLARLIDANFDTRRSIFTLPGVAGADGRRRARVRRQRELRRIGRRDRRHLRRRSDVRRACGRRSTRSAHA